jgi:uncharacterized protein YydD (DUF2326 family)
MAHLGKNRLVDIAQIPTEIRDTRDLEDLKKFTDSQIQKRMETLDYKIFNIKDLLAELNFEGRNKGSKTEAYLESVIAKINDSGKYRWIQFFQLVDVFFIVVEVVKVPTIKQMKLDTAGEIKQHYNPAPAPKLGKTPEETEKNFRKVQEESAPVIVKKDDYVKKNMVKPELPWIKK